MRHKPFPRKDVNKVLSSLVAQGCTVKETTSGFWIGFPDGVSSMVLHFSDSDSRGIKNSRARVKRAGLTWPLD